MEAASERAPALPRVEAGVPRELTRCGRDRDLVVCAWDELRVLHLRTEPGEIREGCLPNHVVTLNLGGEAACDANLDHGGWRTHRTPHHGVAVYPALVPWAAREHDARDYLALEIAPAFVRDVAGSPGAPAELRPVIGARDPFATHVLLALDEEARAHAPTGAARAEGLGAALVTHLLESDLHAALAHAAALPSPKLRRVLDYVAAHLDAPLTLRSLADLAGMEVFRFVRAFRESAGVPPHRYVIEARIARAKELLADRTLSVTEVALRTGFATPSHFSVTFRRIAGATPRAYRDALP